MSRFPYSAVFACLAILALFGSVCWILLLRRSLGMQTRILMERSRELDIALTRAREAARDAENVEADRNAILELVARDEPLERIMRAVCEAAARRLKIAACSVQLNRADGSRLAECPNVREHIAAALSSVAVDSIPESLPSLAQTGFEYPCAAPIRRNRATVGFLVGFSAEPPAEPPLVSGLEAWSNIATLAVERRGFSEQLSYRARHDSLTGLVNRASLYERLELELAKTAEEGKGLSVIFLDLDGFKKINDRHGHGAGDSLLREVGHRLAGSIRRTDVAARVGGDEFVVLLPGVDNRDEAAQIGTLIKDALRVPVSCGAAQLEPGASLGIAVYPADGVQADLLLKFAGEDMYRKKSSRKRRSHDHGVYV